MNHSDAAIKAYNNQDYPTCITHCIEILSKNQKDFEVWKLCAFALWEMGEKLKAIEYLEHSLSIFSDDISAWISLAEMYRKIFQPQKSIEILSNLTPSSSPDLYFNLARAYSDVNATFEAIQCYEEVLKISPKDTQAMHNLGNQYLLIKDICHAKEMYQKASSLGYEDSAINLASVYCKNFEENKAIEIYKSLCHLKSQDAYFYFNYANALRYALDFKESKKMYQKAISISPEPIFFINYAYLLLSLGEYEEGFKHYEKRLMLENILPEGVDKNRILRPCDKDIKGKNILLYHEQGFGDTLMFSRFLDEAILLAKNVQILVQKELRSVFVARYGHLVVKEHIDPYEIALPFPSLPFVLGVENIPSIPSIPSVPSIFGTSPLELKKVQKVGVFFTSYSHSDDSIDRSIPPEKLFECLRDFEDLELYSFQVEGLAKNISEQYNVIDLSPKIADFASTLSYLKEIDLLITIDSAIAHLAGSYGIATIVLLPKRFDWRWGKLRGDRDDKFDPVQSLWYDSLIFLSQEKNGDWDGVLTMLKKYLDERVSNV